MAEAKFLQSSHHLNTMNELGLDEDSSQTTLVTTLATEIVAGANLSSIENIASNNTGIHLNSSSSSGVSHPLSLYQQSHDIWKSFLPSRAALVSNSATPSSTPPSLLPVTKAEHHEYLQESRNDSGFQNLTNSIFMEHIPNVTWSSRLSSTLSVHSGNPSLFLNSISTIATSTGSYWDSVVSNSNNNATGSGATDATSPTNGDMDYDFYPEDELRVSMGLAILLCVAYGLVFVVGIIGNSFVVAVVFRSPRMRTPTNFFIANLAVADLLVVLFCLPATLISNIYSAWILGQWLCKFVSYLQGVSVSASIDTLIAIAIERYLAICHPMKCQISSRVCRILILIIWTFSFSITLPWAIYFQLVPLNPHIPENELMVCMEKWPDTKLGNIYFAVAHVVFCYLLPLTLITICYTLILRKVSMRKIPQETKNLSTELLVQRSKMKVIKMLLLVVALFAISWAPLYSCLIFLRLRSEPTESEENFIRFLMPFAQWLGSSNSCINPILYAFYNKKYRAGFKAVIASGSCCSPLRFEVSSSSKTDSSARSSNRINLSTHINKNGSGSGRNRHCSTE